MDLLAMSMTTTTFAINVEMEELINMMVTQEKMNNVMMETERQMMVVIPYVM